ncbi:hypothetical protein [Natrinema pallidum]|nr:hypothetical protein [Natrinema pallidum]
MDEMLSADDVTREAATRNSDPDGTVPRTSDIRDGTDYRGR